MRWRPLLLTFGFLGLLLAGCSGETMSEVSGNVTVDGVPVEDGAITFIPVGGTGPTAGSPIKSGKYSTKVSQGNNQVKISSPKIVGKKKVYDTPNSPEMPITKEALPEKYNEKTELTFEVKSGANVKDWDLKTK